MYVRNKGQQVAKDVNIAVLYGDFVFNTENLASSLEILSKIKRRKSNFIFRHE